MVCKRFEHPPTLYGHSPFLYLSEPHSPFYDFTKTPTTLYIRGVHSKYREYHLQGLEKVFQIKKLHLAVPCKFYITQKCVKLTLKKYAKTIKIECTRGKTRHCKKS